MALQNQEEFDVHGFAFRLCGKAEAAIRDLASDFQFFRRAAVTDPVTVELICSDPQYDEVPEREAFTYTPRNISFAEGGFTYIDYSGRGLGIWDRGRKRLRVYTRDAHLHYFVQNQDMTVIRTNHGWERRIETYASLLARRFARLAGCGYPV